MFVWNGNHPKSQDNCRSLRSYYALYKEPKSQSPAQKTYARTDVEARVKFHNDVSGFPVVPNMEAAYVLQLRIQGIISVST